MVPTTFSKHQGFCLEHSENLCPASPQLVQALFLRRLLYSSSVNFDLSLLQDSNGLHVKTTLRIELLYMPSESVKPLDVEEPSLDLNHLFGLEKPLLPLPLKLPLLTLAFLKLVVNVVPLLLRSSLLLLLARSVRAEVERHEEFLAASFCKAIMNKYFPVCHLVIRYARKELFLSPLMHMCTAALMSMDPFHRTFELLNLWV